MVTTFWWLFGAQSEGTKNGGKGSVGKLGGGRQELTVAETRVAARYVVRT